ncbi:KptA family-domain-containing protein [Amylostereum chailletii]|nr:KptA family-domain-containing protein [Amylostereum chailletii]
MSKPSSSLEKKRGGGKHGGGKLRGHPKDSPDVRISKTLSWILRHGAKSEGLYMRPDGYVRVVDLLSTPKLKGQLDLEAIQQIVKQDQKQRYGLLMGPDDDTTDAGEIWWIRANQGHSIKAVNMDLEPILSASDIPMAVHGTNKKAWTSISQTGLSRMNRNHIHLAQGVPGDGVISGMRNSAQVLIYVDVQTALEAGLKFFTSENGVVLTEGDERGLLPIEFFSKVEDRNGQPVVGWRKEGAVVLETSEL